MTHPIWGDEEARLATLLERGELLVYPQSPFPLPDAESKATLFRLRVGSGHKNISYDPKDDQLSGLARSLESESESACRIVSSFSHAVTAWLASVFPVYASGWHLDRASYRPMEEATRPARQTARNDLLHIDSFPTRPSQGWRLLRVYANLNPTEDRVWATSETFATLLEKYGEAAGLWDRGASWVGALTRLVPRLWGREHGPTWGYDEMMLRLHHFMKRNEQVQEQSPRKLWHFPPGSVWMLMADTLAHAELRGRFALEHSYFLNPSTLLLPEECPAALWERYHRESRLPSAA